MKIKGWAVVESSDGEVIGLALFDNGTEADEHLAAIVRENCGQPKAETEVAVQQAVSCGQYEEGEYRATIIDAR